MTPDGVKCVRDEYRLMGDGDEKIKTAVDTGIRSFCGSEQEFEKLGWCTVTWDASGLAMEAYPGFRAFLEYKSEESREDYTKK